MSRYTGISVERDVAALIKEAQSRMLSQTGIRPSVSETLRIALKNLNTTENANARDTD